VVEEPQWALWRYYGEHFNDATLLVPQDHSMTPIGAASTMAHEMGHNLGMSHDEDIAGCHCPVPKTDGGCVMAASVG